MVPIRIFMVLLYNAAFTIAAAMTRSVERIDYNHLVSSLLAVENFSCWSVEAATVLL